MKPLNSLAMLLLALGTCCIAPLHAATADRYTPQQLRADIDALQAGIAATHPQPSHSVDPTQLQLALDGLRRRIGGDLDRDGAWREFATLNPLLADGHLFVGYSNWRDETARHLQAGGTLFPFEVAVDIDGTLRIAADLGGSPSALAGRRIESINGLPTTAVAKELLAHVHGDSPRFRAALLSKRWWFFYWKVYGAKAAFDLVLQEPSATRLRRAASTAQPAILEGEEIFDRQFSIELLPDNAAVMTVSTFAWPEQNEFFDFTRRAFEQMKAAGTRTLLIDVRDNGGGNDAMWLQGLLPYFADKPYRWASHYTKKVVRPDDSKGERLGDVLSGTVDSWEQPQPDNLLRFRGRIYVLIGAATYSSAVLFANTMQDFGFAVIAGEGASVRSTQSGGVQEIELPNTGLALWSPRFVLTRPSGRKEPEWLTPDLPIEDDPLKSQTMVDAVLEAEAAKQRAKQKTI